jgi:hypothetical protein
MPASSSTPNAAFEFFCNKFAPATKDTASDFFTTRFIQSIIYNHTGDNIDLMELNQLLKDMNYCYELIDGEFRWMVTE